MDKVCTLISLALMLKFSAAEKKVFSQVKNLTWEAARNHCKVCYTDLVTLTPENIQTLSLKVVSDHWVGLRKYLPSNASMPWSRWANGDPLAFQNWYPGWPLKKPAPPKEECCSCSCMCPAGAKEEWNASTPSYSSTSGSTSTPDYSSTSGSTSTPGYSLPGCVPSPAVPSTHNYIEDSCVAMLSSRAWVERNCSELLPFICYEERFFAEVNVTDVTSTTASLSWQEVPGHVMRYHLKVNGRVEKLNGLTFDLDGLEGGTLYLVQVFPVKCGREGDPQEATFYTFPHKVKNLTAPEVTETSITLRWTRPPGLVDFYLIKYQGKINESDTEQKRVTHLTPGNIYTFTIFSVVNKTQLSDGSTVTAYTKPGKVSDLKVSGNTEDSLHLQWVTPAGNTSGYRVTAANDSKYELFNDLEKGTQLTVRRLPAGTRITLSVRALANDTLEGEAVSITNYTAPGQISDLRLIPTHESLTASWTPAPGSYSYFTVTLNHEDTNPFKVEEPCKFFGGLMAAANYTVTIFAVSGDLIGPSTTRSKYTLLLPPNDAKANFSDEQQITFLWSPPLNSASVTYNVTLTSSFWGQRFTNYTHDTNYTFTGLNSGTRYDFEVRAQAGGNYSGPAKASHSTEAAIREISLSMLCSSPEPLTCDAEATRESTFEKLHEHFKKNFRDDVFWELKMQKSEN